MRGPKVTPGYWCDEELTRQTWRGGWFHTGDAGVIDADGYLSITDRIKEMIKSGGENVASQEIERVDLHPSGCRRGRRHRHPRPALAGGAAGVCRAQGRRVAHRDELIEHCRAQLAGFKTPKSVRFVTELPRNASGKVLKRQLRESAARSS